MRRFSKAHRSQSWSAMSIDANMEAGRSKSPASSTRSSGVAYDTGFPEPFCGIGNTTRRHPEANTSPDACISSDHFDDNHVYNRSRRSFLYKSRRTMVNHGKLSSADIDECNELASIDEAPKTTNAYSSSGSIYTNSRASKDGGDSLNRPSSSAHSDKSLHQRNDNGTHDRPTTSSVMRKLRLHS